jgi:hypothetical protein
MPLKMYYPGENEENYDNSVRIAGKMKRSKGKQVS